MVITKKELGKLIKSAREIKSRKIERKYTQKMLASDIGKSQSYIGDMESGRTYPSFVILNAIAEACGVHMSYFESSEKIIENTNHIDTEYITAKKLIENVLRSQVILDHLGLDKNKLTDEDFQEFAEDVLSQIKLISYKYSYKYKNRGNS